MTEKRREKWRVPQEGECGGKEGAERMRRINKKQWMINLTKAEGGKRGGNQDRE